MLRFVYLLALLGAVTSQGTSNTIVSNAVQMPNIPTGASNLGTVAAATSNQQIIQSGPVPVSGNQLTGAFQVPVFNPTQQSVAFIGQQPMVQPAQPMNTIQTSIPFGAQAVPQSTQQIIGSPVPPPSVGPLASLAAQKTLANSLVPSNSNNPMMNPLMFALGGSDNFLPYYLMSQTGLLQRNPLMGMLMMKNM